jgi:hypothetical protein
MKKLGFLLTLGAMLALWLALAAPASARDRNHDRIPDRWEKRHHLSLKVKQTRKDQDRDGLRNMGEWRKHTNPRDADSDDDGMDDGDEVRVGDDPRDDDSDDDGVEDGDENAGTIASFDQTTGALTITLFDGSAVSGQVTDATELECEGSDKVANNDGEDPGDEGDEGDEGGDSGDEDEDASCSTADLQPGRIVHEAELELTPDGPVFEEVELTS